MPVPFTMEQSQFEYLWPFVDNIWSKKDDGIRFADSKTATVPGYSIDMWKGARPAQIRRLS